MKKEFTVKLTTAIQSSPIVYIPHFHYNFVDEVLKDILMPDDMRLALDPNLNDNIIEFDCGLNTIVDFAFKRDEDDMVYNDIELLLKDIVSRWRVLRLGDPMDHAVGTRLSFHHGCQLSWWCRGG